jgi:hypothetical protein
MRRSVIVASTVAVFLATNARADSGFIYGLDVTIEEEYFATKIIDSNATPATINETVPPYGSFNGMSHIAGTGVNKASMAVNLTSSVQSPITFAVAAAYAEWYDQITISDPILNGTQGTFSATMLVNGTGGATGSGPWLSDPTAEIFGGWRTLIGVGDGSTEPVQDGWEGRWVNDPVTGTLRYEGDPLGQIQSAVSFQFTFGEPFILQGDLQTVFIIDNFEASQGTLNGFVDLSNSAYWGGITQVRDAQGNVIANPTIISDSGVQWGNAIDPGVLLGDSNGDGLVNIGDFSTLASRFNQNVSPWTFGDATGDGRVAISDFAILASHFNQNVGRNAAVPEPVGATVLIAGLLLRRRSE